MKDITLASRLQSLQPIDLTRKNEIEKADKAEGAPNFADVLKKAIEDVSGIEKEADKVVEALAAGSSDNIHEAMIALQKADLSFRTMMEIRDKLLSAYKEIMRISV
ncbi:flagellar hook-basal body complex protein FliE [bacterium]|nr:flagellar hook-basal body complex protein FliE [bacterium]